MRIFSAIYYLTTFNLRLPKILKRAKVESWKFKPSNLGYVVAVVPVVYFFAVEGGEFAPKGAEDGGPGADIPLLDQRRVHVRILCALDDLPGLEARPTCRGHLDVRPQRSLHTQYPHQINSRFVC